MMSSFRNVPAPLLFVFCLRSAVAYASPSGEPTAESPPPKRPAAPSPSASPGGAATADAADASKPEDEKAEPAPAPLSASAPRSTERLSAFDRSRLEAAAHSDEEFARAVAQRKRALVKQTLARGDQLMQSSPFELAGRALAVAYALDPQPQLLLQIARAFQRAKQDTAALAFYQRFVKENPTSPQEKEVAEIMVGLRLEVDSPDEVTDRVIKEHIDLGKTYYQSAQYREAAEVYAVAYSLKLAPRYLFNVGQGYRRAGQFFAAYAFYQRYLQEDPQTPVRRETEGYLVDLRTQMNQPAPKPSKRNWIIGGVAIGVGVLALGLGLGLGLGLRKTEPPTDGGIVALHF